MKASEVIDIFKDAIKRSRKDGVSTVSLDSLEIYASELEQIALRTPEGVASGEAANEAYKAELSNQALWRQQTHEINLEMLRSTIATGQSALKSSLLINGGAAVAVLAFMGNIWSSKDATTALPAISEALLMYIGGVLVAAFAAGATYISQAGFGGEFGCYSALFGRFGQAVAILCVIAAYIYFGYGSWLAYLAFGGSA